MDSKSRRYERNACFYLWVYSDKEKPELVPMPVKEKIFLPISQKYYKTTLKNIKTYLGELLEYDDSIVKVEIERGTHVGSIERNGDEDGKTKD